VKALRTTVVMAAVMLAVASCGSGPSVAEYADSVESLVLEMNLTLGALERERSEGPRSIESEQAHLTARVQARDDFLAALRALEPPDRIEELHAIALRVVERLTEAERTMATEAATAETWSELDAVWSGEANREFLAADQDAYELCLAAQQEFDELEGDAFASGTPWVPPELREVVQVALTCEAIE
jgi:hypothetical protein